MGCTLCFLAQGSYTLVFQGLGSTSGVIKSQEAWREERKWVKGHCRALALLVCPYEAQGLMNDMEGGGTVGV